MIQKFLVSVTLLTPPVTLCSSSVEVLEQLPGWFPDLSRPSAVFIKDRTRPRDLGDLLRPEAPQTGTAADLSPEPQRQTFVSYFLFLQHFNLKTFSLSRQI